MQVTPIVREFCFNGIRLPDVNSSIPVEEVRSIYATQYPDITTASISGPELVNGKMRYTFERAIGSKG